MEGKYKIQIKSGKKCSCNLNNIQNIDMGKVSYIKNPCNITTSPINSNRYGYFHIWDQCQGSLEIWDCYELFCLFKFINLVEKFQNDLNAQLIKSKIDKFRADNIFHLQNV